MRQLARDLGTLVAKARAGEQVRLAELQCAIARWSPKGNLIAFGTRGAKRAIYVMRANTGGLRPVTDPATDARDPTWSPDGEHLACSIRQGDDWQIAVVRLGGGPKPITRGPGIARQPAWSPDGKHIAFVKCEKGRSDIYVVPVGGGEAVRLTDSSSANLWPSWSPDSQKIAFATDREGTWRVYTMRPNGTQQARVADVVAEWPAWRPDGAALAYAGTTEPRSARGPLPRGICVLDLREGAARLLRAGALCSAPDWSPDGKRILFLRNFRPYVLDVETDAAVALGSE